MSPSWVGADEVLASYADDLDDPRAAEEADRIRRAQDRANAVVRHVLAERRTAGRGGLVEPDDLDDDILDDTLEDGLDDGVV